ncbi:hypothetical protein D3C75_777390 [compost metagenome]
MAAVRGLNLVDLPLNFPKHFVRILSFKPIKDLRTDRLKLDPVAGGPHLLNQRRQPVLVEVSRLQHPDGFQVLRRAIRGADHSLIGQPLLFIQLLHEPEQPFVICEQLGFHKGQVLSEQIRLV